MNENLETFVRLCLNAKRYRKSDLTPIDICKKYITDLHTGGQVKCMCSYLGKCLFSNELLYFVALKCKQICNFCKYQNTQTNDLYQKIKQLRYQQLKNIYDFTDVEKNKNIIQNKDNLSNITFFMFIDIFKIIFFLTVIKSLIFRLTMQLVQNILQLFIKFFIRNCL